MSLEITGKMYRMKSFDKGFPTFSHSFSGGLEEKELLQTRKLPAFT